VPLGVITGGMTVLQPLICRSLQAAKEPVLSPSSDKSKPRFGECLPENRLATEPHLGLVTDCGELAGKSGGHQKSQSGSLNLFAGQVRCRS